MFSVFPYIIMVIVMIALFIFTVAIMLRKMSVNNAIKELQEEEKKIKN